MFKKSDPAANTPKTRTDPFTPMRRFLFKLELLNPIAALGKRARDQSHVADISEEHLQGKKTSLASSSYITTTEPGTVPPIFVKDQGHQQTRQGMARIALQQHDQPLDAIVITTLPSYPFCCHEDLLTMSRTQLVEVAAMLNSRLPAFSQIEFADGIPDAHIRYSIETLVGIVPDMPGAPKAIKSRPFERMDIDLLGDPEQDILPSPPTSPLSMRVTRRQEKAFPVMMNPPHFLERLEEEDEQDFFTMKRLLKKKRKTSRPTMTIIVDQQDIDMDEDTPVRDQDLRLPMSLESPTPSANTSFPSSHMVLRSHSRRRIQGLQQQPSSPSPFSSPDVFKVDSAFVNLKPRYRSMGTKNGRKVASGSSQPGSSRKTNKAKRDFLEKHNASIRLNYRPFEIPASDSERRYHMPAKPLSFTSTKSNNSSDEKAAIAAAAAPGESNSSGFGKTKTYNSGNSLVEQEDNQVAGGIKNMTVG